MTRPTCFLLAQAWDFLMFHFNVVPISDTKMIIVDNKKMGVLYAFTQSMPFDWRVESFNKVTIEKCVLIVVILLSFVVVCVFSCTLYFNN